MAVVDTNVIIRLITMDNDEHSRRAHDIFERIEAGTQPAFLPESVLVEIVQVLSSKNLYNLSRETIRERLGPIMRMPAIEIENKRTCLRALDVYVDIPRLSFVDALCVVHAQRFDDAAVVSFDRGFRNIDSLEWLEP